jgi:hypothetical protein
MTGYYNQPAETAAAFTADGFMRTGDIAVMQEDGYSRIVDRKKDMILVSGFNVFPNELENVISLCPGVVECAAVGVPDEKQGEAIKVFVVRRDPTLTEDAVLQYCHSQLTGYKRPKHIEFRDSLPKTNVGKILRRELRVERGRLNERSFCCERWVAGECRGVRAGMAVVQQRSVRRCRGDGGRRYRLCNACRADLGADRVGAGKPSARPHPEYASSQRSLRWECGAAGALPGRSHRHSAGRSSARRALGRSSLEFCRHGAGLSAVCADRVVGARNGLLAWDRGSGKFMPRRDTILTRSSCSSRCRVR